MTSIVSQSQKQIVIVGAGLAGLAAARLLTQEGHSPIVLDKGRRIGGRCGTRVSSEGGFLFNHGAQFVTASGSSTDAPFAALCREAEKAGVLSLVSNPDSHTNGNAVYAVKASAARDLPSWMAEGLDVRQNIDVQRILKQENGQLRLTTANNNQDGNGNGDSDSDSVSFVADRLVVTAPAPQAAKLLQEAAPALAATALTARYDPCWEVLAGFEKRGDSDDSDGMPTCDIPQDSTSSSDIIGWYKHSYSANGHCTGSSNTGAALTIQATAAWSKAHLDASNGTVATQIYNAYTRLASRGGDASATPVQAVPVRILSLSYPSITALLAFSDST
jgi:predicted NAD/FAD-dependent oxidoreductase